MDAPELCHNLGDKRPLAEGRVDHALDQGLEILWAARVLGQERDSPRGRGSGRAVKGRLSVERRVDRTAKGEDVGALVELGVRCDLKELGWPEGRGDGLGAQLLELQCLFAVAHGDPRRDDAAEVDQDPSALIDQDVCGLEVAEGVGRGEAVQRQQPLANVLKHVQRTADVALALVYPPLQRSPLVERQQQQPLARPAPILHVDVVAVDHAPGLAVARNGHDAPVDRGRNAPVLHKLVVERLRLEALSVQQRISANAVRLTDVRRFALPTQCAGS